MIRKVTGRVFVALVLGAWAASLAQADARQRGAKHPANAAHHAGQHHVGGGAARPPSPSGNRRPALDAALPRKNAIGMTTPQARIGAPVAGPSGISGTGAVGSVKANVIGTRPGTVGSLPAPAHAAKIGPATSPATGVRPAAPALLAHGGGISGTGITRPGTAPGVVGGPAKLAGGITGTGMKRRAQ
jgi:hypothetical protein